MHAGDNGMAHGAVIYAKRLDTLLAFYCELDMNIVECEKGDFAVLCTEGISRTGTDDTHSRFELTIVQAPENIASQIAISSPPLPRSQNSIKLSVVVASIDGALEKIDSLGGISNTNFERWQYRGQMHHDVVDPEGNIIQLKQSVSTQDQ